MRRARVPYDTAETAVRLPIPACFGECDRIERRPSPTSAAGGTVRSHDEIAA